MCIIALLAKYDGESWMNVLATTHESTTKLNFSAIATYVKMAQVNYNDSECAHIFSLMLFVTII
jgi:PleD family two-component response regulator